MTFAAIMVHVDFDPDAENRIRLAATLAVQFNAVLIGAAGWRLRADETLKFSETESPPINDSREQRVIKQLEYLGERFQQVASDNKPKGVEWRSTVYFPREFVAEQARIADLLVIGQLVHPNDIFHTYDPGTIILASGRPVLVVPPGIDRLQAAHVLIAWKNTREARRAIRDSLPLLVTAQKVSIAAVNQNADDFDAQIADVMLYLTWHGVRSSKQIITTVMQNDGDLLMDIAAQEHVDLIVAGAYGHTRLSEWIFGGVTRQLLAASPVPCLFSN